MEQVIFECQCLFHGMLVLEWLLFGLIMIAFGENTQLPDGAFFIYVWAYIVYSCCKLAIFFSSQMFVKENEEITLRGYGSVSCR